MRHDAEADRPVPYVGSKKPPHVIVMSFAHGRGGVEPVLAEAASVTVGRRATRDASTRPRAASTAARLCTRAGCTRSAISIAFSSVRISWRGCGCAYAVL